MSTTRGRPKGEQRGEQEARQKLIGSARALFIQKGYSKVSTRLIAEHAGLNAGMIRYYFSDKAGLFEATLRETLAPMVEELSRRALTPQSQDVAAMIGVYYQVMGSNPDLPKLVFRSLHDTGSPEHKIVSKVFGGFLDKALQSFGLLLTTPGVLKEGCEVTNSLLSTISLAVFPFLMPSLVLKKLKIEINQEFLTPLAEHNGALLTCGMLKDNAVGEIS